MKTHRTPGEIVQTLVEAGEVKATKSWSSIFLAAILAGIFISLGSVGFIIMSARVDDPGLGVFAGSVVFPVGLIMVVLLGGELFTGNALMTFGIARKKYTYKKLLRNWIIAWTGNLVGSLSIVYLGYGAKIFPPDIAQRAIDIANIKTSHSFSQAILLGILCNIIVVLVIMLSMSAKDVTGTVLTIFIGIMLFALSGYEHIVANMFFVPIGKLFGADITWLEIFRDNFLPVTIGNMIGGALVVPALFYGIYHKDLNK